MFLIFVMKLNELMQLVDQANDDEDYTLED